LGMPSGAQPIDHLIAEGGRESDTPASLDPTAAVARQRLCGRGHGTAEAGQRQILSSLEYEGFLLARTSYSGGIIDSDCCELWKRQARLSRSFAVSQSVNRQFS
jgi:hypothetical protein